MPERPELFLAERVWAHPSTLAAEDTTVERELDDAGRVVATRYSDGQTEKYTYDDEGRVVGIDEHPMLWSTVAGHAQRWSSGGKLAVDYDARGAVRIGNGEEIAWERCEEPWPQLLERGARSLADRCVAAIAEVGLDPATEVYCLMLMYVGDGGLHTLVNAGMEDDRREILAGDEPDEIAINLWYPESEAASFLDVEDDPEDELVLREAALNDVREAQRTVLTEVAKLLARRDWTGVLAPTEDFIVYIAEHDEAFAPKHASVREVNPAERLAVWDARWPDGVSRGEDEL